MTTDDMTLVREFAANQSEPAFAALVERYVGLVHSAALRQTGDAHLAEEITQAVFIVLARKAASLGDNTILPAWLYRATRFAAADALKLQRRRREREQEAYMQSTLQTNHAADAWQQMAPLLDDAMADLPERDRAALVLRYFENRPWQEVAALTRTKEDAAQKRVGRALEKLQKFFTKRGLTFSVAVIAGAVSANCVQAAPMDMAVKISLVAGKGLATTTTITALVKGTMKTMTWLKLKFGIGATAVILLAGGLAAVAVSQVNSDDRSTPRAIAQQSYDAYAALNSYIDICKGTTSSGGSDTETTCNINLQRPNHYRVEWTQTGGFFTSKGAVWSDGSANYEVMATGDTFDSAPPQKTQDMKMAFGMATGVSSSTASSIPGAFYQLAFGDKLGVVAMGRTETSRKPDEKIGDTDCYVIMSVLDASKLQAKLQASHPNTPLVANALSGVTTTTFWIGKADHLIRKIETRMTGSTMQGELDG